MNRTSRYSILTKYHHGSKPVDVPNGGQETELSHVGHRMHVPIAGFPTSAAVTDPERGRSVFLQPQKSWKKLSSSSEIDLIAHNADQATLRRYLLRSGLNIFGPLLLVITYIVVVAMYLVRPVVNDISPWRPISPRGLFFAWMVASIFIIDWSKSGLASLEAALLSRSTWWTPSSAQEFMWHADRSWATLNGWARAIVYLFGRRSKELSKSPSVLWCYLCTSSLLLYAAIPLAGLSLETRNTFKLGGNLVLASGANQTNFDLNSANEIAQRTDQRWRTGDPVVGSRGSILYAPDGTNNASAAYFEDSIQDIYQQDLRNVTTINRAVTFFTGPSVTERVHGTAWGLKTTVACFPVNPLNGLKNMQVRSLEDWSGTPIFGTTMNSSFSAAANYTGSSPLYMFRDSAFGFFSVYFIANSQELPQTTRSDYVDKSALPIKGSLDLVMWQDLLFSPDEAWQNITKSPHTISAVSHVEDDEIYYGYGVRCEVESTTGFADLNAALRTFTNFRVAAADRAPVSKYGQVNGVLAIQDLVFSAFTSLNINNQGRTHNPECVNNLEVGGGSGCGAWYGANQATQGSVAAVPRTGIGDAIPRFGPITPERMTLAMYKLFGTAAVTMMSTGSTNWGNSLQGLEGSNDLVEGLVPWQIPLALLVVWALSVVVPSVMTFGERRFASTVGSFEMFRLGSEWKEAQIAEKKDDHSPARSQLSDSRSRDVSPAEAETDFTQSQPSYNPVPSIAAHRAVGHDDYSYRNFI